MAVLCIGCDCILNSPPGIRDHAVRHFQLKIDILFTRRSCRCSFRESPSVLIVSLTGHRVSPSVLPVVGERSPLSFSHCPSKGFLLPEGHLLRELDKSSARMAFFLMRRVACLRCDEGLLQQVVHVLRDGEEDAKVVCRPDQHASHVDGLFARVDIDAVFLLFFAVPLLEDGGVGNEWVTRFSVSIFYHGHLDCVFHVFMMSTSYRHSAHPGQSHWVFVCVFLWLMLASRVAP